MIIYTVKTDIEGLYYLVSDQWHTGKLAVEINGFDGNARPFQLIPELNSLMVH